MRVFILLAAAAVLVITVAEGIPLAQKDDSFSGGEDNSIISSKSEERDSILNAEDKNINKDDENDEDAQQIIPESRHRGHRKREPWNYGSWNQGQFPPGGFLPPPPPIYPGHYYPYPYPYPYPHYPYPLQPPYYRPTEATTESPTEPTTELSSTLPPPPLNNDTDASLPINMNMTVEIGNQNLTLSQVTCLLDFFLNPSEDTKLEHCINDGVERDPDDNNNTEGEEEYTENSTSVGNESTDGDDDLIEDSTDGDDNSEDDENSPVSTTTPRVQEDQTTTTTTTTPEEVMSTTPSVDVVNTGGHYPGPGIVISPGSINPWGAVLPQISVVGNSGKQKDPNDLINNLFGGINNLLGTIVSAGAKQPPVNYYHPSD